MVRSDVQNRDLTRHDLSVVHSRFRKLHACDVRAREKKWLMLLLLYNQQPSFFAIDHLALVALSNLVVLFASTAPHPAGKAGSGRNLENVGWSSNGLMLRNILYELC